MYRRFRVVKPLQWNGWLFGPQECSSECRSNCHQRTKDDPVACKRKGGSDCPCALTTCRCGCGKPAKIWGGDVVIVEDGHPNLDNLVLVRKVVDDPALPDADTLLQEDKYKRLLTPPKAAAAGAK